MQKGDEADQGVYLGERFNDAGLVVDVYLKDDEEVEVPLPDEEQEARRQPPEEA